MNRDSEEPFPTSVYWAVVVAAVVVMLLLGWFTEHFNIPLGGA